MFNVDMGHSSNKHISKTVIDKETACYADQLKNKGESFNIVEAPSVIKMSTCIIFECISTFLSII